MKKYIKAYLLLILCAIIGLNFISMSTSTASAYSAYASAMCVLEGNTNTVLYEQNAASKLAMASTTKIMTAIATLQNVENLDDIVKVADESVGIEGTSIYLQKNEEISVRSLLYGLILASGNDAATALAYHVGGTEQGFVDIMNELAQDIGAHNTHFDNPHGLDSATHYTTAYDLALITSYALKDDNFKDIVSTKYKQIPGTEKSGERYLRNKNKLLFYQENNVGVKTGFTDDAGRCLVNAVEQDGMQIITVLLNCGPMFDEGKRLTDLALSEYIMKEFVLPYNYVGNVAIENGDKKQASIVSIKGYKLPIKKSQEDKYETIYDLPDTIQAPIEKNQKIGTVKVYYDGELVFEDELYSIEAIKNVDIKYMLNNIIENWF